MASAPSMAAAIAASLPTVQAAPAPAAPTHEALPASMVKLIDPEAEIPVTTVELSALVRPPLLAAAPAG
jgi:translation initiation factor 3 subunit H